jgi:hypothetical protein
MSIQATCPRLSLLVTVVCAAGHAVCPTLADGAMVARWDEATRHGDLEQGSALPGGKLPVGLIRAAPARHATSKQGKMWADRTSVCPFAWTAGTRPPSSVHVEWEQCAHEACAACSW